MKTIRTIIPPYGHKKPIGYIPPSLSWLPDWKKAEEYSYLENASSKQFAWEFLRRNPHYRAMRETISEEYADRTELLKAAENIFLERNIDGSLEVKNSNDDLQCFDQVLHTFYIYFGILSFPPDPATRLAEPIFETVKILGGAKNKTHLDFYMSDTEAACIVDLEIPLADSIKVMKKYLTALKKSKKSEETKDRRKQSLDKYIRYLRVLDAHASGYQNTYIGKFVHTNPENSNEYLAESMKDAHEAAKLLVNNRYKFLGSKEK